MTLDKKDRDKKVIGLYGEMRLAMELHQRNWQVYRAYIDETFDFVIMKCWCEECRVFTKALIKTQEYQNRNRKCVTNLCDECHGDTLKMVVRLVQVKTSEGKHENPTDINEFSFHPKIRYHIADGRMFYVWIAVWDNDNVHFYIFKPEDVNKFDDITLDTYQVTDNQKTALNIAKDGQIKKKGKKHNYNCFQDFKDNFAIFDEIIDGVDFAEEKPDDIPID